MSANIVSSPSSPVSVSVSALAQIASNGTSDPNAVALIDASGQGPFDALFRQLLVKQTAAGADANSPLLSMPATATTTTAPKNDTDTAVDDLSALLPFLDAMGLTQTAPVTTTASPPTVSHVDATSLVDTPPTDAALTVLAGPASIPVASYPAISAAVAAIESTTGSTTAAPSKALPSLTSTTKGNAVMQSTAGLPMVSLAADRSTDTIDTIDTPVTSLGTPSIGPAQTEDSLPNREFSSQLLTAIAANKEQSHLPGSTAAVVQQVIANAVPHTAQQTALPSLPVAQPVGTSGWSEEISNRVVWMANRMESRAELVLTPPQMGRVEVSLSITGDQATANFVSGNPAVREALEAALPRLREVLADAGIQLGQTQVSAENAHQWAQQEKNSDNFGFNRGTSSDNATLHADSGALPASTGLKAGRGLVDVFA